MPRIVTSKHDVVQRPSALSRIASTNRLEKLQKRRYHDSFRNKQDLFTQNVTKAIHSGYRLLLLTHLKTIFRV